MVVYLLAAEVIEVPHRQEFAVSPRAGSSLGTNQGRAWQASGEGWLHATMAQICRKSTDGDNGEGSEREHWETVVDQMESSVAMHCC